MIAPVTMSLRPGRPRPPSLAVVCWRGADGFPVSSYPLPRPLAEAVAHAFAGTYPRETFWIESLPWLAPDEAIAGTAEATRPIARPAGAHRAPPLAP